MAHGSCRSSDDGRMFKTLRRMRGHDLDCGLNDLTEAFASFVTRAKFFSVGHLRRTWSHSAVEFMKYRRRLPAILADDAAFSQSHESRADVPAEHSGGQISLKDQQFSRQLHVANVPPKVTLAQLTSFFSKFGRVAFCAFSEDKPAATLPRRNKGSAYVTFHSDKDAERLLNAEGIELIFYSQSMTVSLIPKTSEFKTDGNPPMLRYPHPSIGSLSSDAGAEPSQSAERCSSDFFFNELPENVLSLIFSHLNFLDRIRLEKVCKLWQECSFQSWSHTKCLVLSNSSTSQRNSFLHNNSLKEILHRAGPHILSLNLCGAAHFLNDYSLTLIAQYCKLLKAVNFTGLKVQWKGLKIFAQCCGAQLNSIVYREAFFLGDNAFWWLLRSSPNLITFDAGNCSQLTGKCFRSLGTNLQSLKLDGCQAVRPAALQEMCLKCPSLRCLALDGCVLLDDATLAAICRSLPHLEFLSLRFDHSFPDLDEKLVKNRLNFTAFGLRQLAHLANLKNLHFEGNPVVDDSVLEALFKASSCSRTLHALWLSDSGAGSITAGGLTSVFCNISLNLRHVDFSHLQSAVDDQFLISLAKTIGSILLTLNLRACTQITDSAVQILAQNCSQLQTLDVSNCFLITNSSIKEFFYTCRNLQSLEIFFSPLAHLSLTLSGTSCKSRPLLRALQASQNFDCIDLNFEGVGAELQRHVQCNDDFSGLNFSCSRLDDKFDDLMAQRSYIMDELEEDDPEAQ